MALFLKKFPPSLSQHLCRPFSSDQAAPKVRYKWTKERKAVFRGALEELGGINKAKFGDIWERLKASGVTYPQLSSYYQAYKLKAKASRSGEWSLAVFLPYGLAACSFGSFATAIYSFISLKNRDQIAVEVAAKRFEKEARARDELLKVQQDQLAELKKKNSSSSWLWSWFTGV